MATYPYDSYLDMALLMDGPPRDWCFAFARAMRYEILGGDRLMYVSSARRWWVYIGGDVGGWGLVNSDEKVETGLSKYITRVVQSRAGARVVELWQQGVEDKKLERARKRVSELRNWANIKRIIGLVKEVFVPKFGADFTPDGNFDMFDALTGARDDSSTMSLQPGELTQKEI